MKSSFKRVLSLGLVLVMALSLAACSKPKEPEATAYTAGSYTATERGHNGLVTVKVDFSEDAITAVEVTEHSESPGISDAPIADIPAAIVEYQSLGIDTVAGATATSNAILAAVANCVNQAGGDAEALKAVAIEKKAGEPIVREVDVVVVGGGGAGVAAAASAVQNGASVVLLEKTAALGGNTLASGGGSTTWNAVIPEKVAATPSMTGQEDSLRAFLEYDPAELPEGYDETLVTLQGQIKEYLAGDTSTMFDSVELHIIQTYFGGLRQDLDGNWIYGKYEFVRTLCEESPKSAAWLESMGGKFRETLGEPIGSMWKRALGPATNNQVDLFDPTTKVILDNGGEIIYNTRAEKLISEDGKVVGVTGTMADGTPVEVRAKSVVLTTGGFAANSEMVIEYNNYWPELSADIKTTNVSGSVGDGINMALEVGAALTGMEFAQLMPIGWADNGQLALGAGNNVMYIGPDGTRFTNEYAERDVISKAAFGVGGVFYEIKSQSEDNFNHLARVDDGTNMVFAADTLAELAEMINVPADALEAEVEKYNGYVREGVDPEFGKNVFSAYIEAPYMARVLSPSSHHTMGGVVIDTSCHVLNEDGDIIPGLYAAGEVTGGIHAGNRLGGNAIADVFVFGRIAGESAAKAS
jgi:urocanate reductase